MFTPGELILITAAVFVIGIAVSLCISFLYLMMRIIDKRINPGPLSDQEKPKQVEKIKYSVKEKAEAIKDDVPFATPPVRVETSFDDRRIGKM